MRILHTSDWHIGRQLHGMKRYDEFEQFFAWIEQVIESEKIDLLLVAGDIFDTTTPSNRAQELYYSFLCRLRESGCSDVVIIGGNHDSPSFLAAPKDLLRHINVHVIPSALNPEDEVIVLNDRSGNPALIVCAVPYLRDRDVRTVEAGESYEDKETKLRKGIYAHYQDVYDHLLQLQNEDNSLPVIAMGHLFTEGGKTVKDDGVRDLYVGNLSYVHHDLFPEWLSYTALGHLHVEQSVGRRENVRYSGSPIAMGFHEKTHGKKVVIVDITKENVDIDCISVPVFQELVSVSGKTDEILRQLDTLCDNGSKAWIEVVHTGSDYAHVRDVVARFSEDKSLSILKITSEKRAKMLLSDESDNRSLSDMGEVDVFDTLLEQQEVLADDREVLKKAYGEILAAVYEDDKRAE